MNKENVSRIIGYMNEKYVNEATMFALPLQQEMTEPCADIANPSPKPHRRVKWGVLAAGLVFCIIIGSAATAIAVDAKEFHTAVAFFEKNGLSTEGLSRSEVKAVYRDITTNRFTYGKTAKVLQQAVPGWEIEQDEPTPEELAALWKNVWMKSISQNGIDYHTDYQYVLDETRGYEVLKKSILDCYQDGDRLWQAEFTDLYLEGYAYTKGGTAVWGINETHSSSDTTYGWIALVDHKGNILWQRRLDHDFKHEYVASILRNPDGTWAVISRGDMKYLCLSCYDADGKECRFHKTEVGNFGIRNAARLGEGYIVQLWNSSSGDTALLYKMDRDGVLTDHFSYEEDSCDYYITDMIEFEGQVFLSAYAVPKQQDEGGRHEIADILDYLFSKGMRGSEISSEELTPMVRDNYTAILLLCDPERGAPKTFYSVKGSLGGKLAVNAPGTLEWNVESITSTFFSPATSSFTIGGTCRVSVYAFNETGKLTGKRDTEETVPYRR